MAANVGRQMSDLGSIVIEMMKRDLLKKAMKGQWSKVVEIYKNEKWTHKEKITRSGETALHIAVSDGQTKIVMQLIEAIKSQTDHAKEAVGVENKQGNTALHFAASKEKEPIMCKSIAEVNPSLVGCRNHEGETPFFLAAFHGKKRAFLYLHQICADTNQDGFGYSIRNDDNTTLHCAINGQHFDLAYQIIQSYPGLVNRINKEGLSPLHILAAKPSAFRSGKPQGAISIWHRAIRKFVDTLTVSERPHDDDDDNHRPSPKDEDNIPNNHPKTTASTRGTIGTGEGIHDESDHTDQNSTAIDINNISADHEDSGKHRDHGGIYPNLNRSIDDLKTSEIIFWSMLIISLFLYFLYILTSELIIGMLLLPFGIKGYRRRSRRMVDKIMSTYDVEEKHRWANLTLNKLLDHTELYQAGFETWASVAPEPKDRDSTKRTDNDHESNQSSPAEEDKETPILTAAKYGVIEMVEKILELYPIAIYDVTSVTKKNIVLLAVEKRQIHVYQHLLEKTIPTDSVFGHVDEDGNSALHLAAKFAPETPRPGMIPCLQMLWEIRWYQFVKDSMPADIFPLHNKKNKTPLEIFTEDHGKLVQSGGKWLSSTSKSSSVVATLILSVAFATAASIPGGLKQDCGTPMYEDQPAFYIFAFSSLFALFFSITSVVMFFSLISSPYEARDFSSDLPVKLLMSLMTLFMGIASMLISFCAAQFFLLHDKQKTGALVSYAVVVALVIYSTIKNSSVFLDLLRVTCNNVPQRLYEDDF